MLDKNIPQHIGIIMDGNRRWAKKHKLSILGGHQEAADKIIEPLIERAGNLGIKYLTFWCFSTENWKRSKFEVTGLMKIFRYVIRAKLSRFAKKGARLGLIGDISKFPKDIQEEVKQASEKTKDNKKITVNFALNYGGRDEIVRAFNKWLGQRPKAKDQRSKIKEQELEDYLDTAGQPDPDLIIRTGGEQRSSGFLTWQSVYSELYFTEVLFPDFTVERFDEAIREFQKRQRRFGK